VIGAVALGFVGVTFLLAWLIAGLFDLIGIDLVKDLLKESWFGWMLAGFAFGAAFGLLRERDALMATLQRLVMVVLGVLAPVLAVALILFLASLPFTGLGGLWDSSLPATGLMLLSAAGAVLLANAVIGNGEDDRASNRVLHISALALVLAVLPLAIIAAISIGQRIGQYGWTPERIWGVVAVAVAIAYGAVGWWTVARGRQRFDDVLRPLQTRLALGLCGLALFLALPILDFGAISASSQLARFTGGKVDAKEFDWRAMAFDFGPAGRQRLAEIARTGPLDQRPLATTALASKNHYSLEEDVGKAASAASLDRNVRVLPEGTRLTPGQRNAIAEGPLCRASACMLRMIDPRTGVIAGRTPNRDDTQFVRILSDGKGRWTNHWLGPERSVTRNDVVSGAKPSTDLADATVEVRRVERRQIYIDGKPIGEAFE